MTYTADFTDSNKTQITVPEKSVQSSGLDITMVGKNKLEYGEVWNENLFHLLENFACPELSGTPDVPDLALTYTDLLAEPIEGQFWYNMTQKRMFFWDTVQWVGIGTQGDISANWGRVCHGEQLPIPTHPNTDYTFTYDDCIWAVSPASYTIEFDYMACSTDINAAVTMRYRIGGDTILIDGVANYLIIGISKGNSDIIQVSQPPVPTPTSTVTPTGTPTTSPIL